MGSHNPFGHFKHKLWPKEGLGIKFKIWNLSNFLAFRWLATYHWKALDKGYDFSLNPISIEGLHTKLWAPKVAGVPTLGIKLNPKL